ncbi:hypothetical protein Hanom_Chr17g01580601 [Helianthus anomalus]
MITDNDDPDNVLALPLPLLGQHIVGYPDGGHLIEPIPIHAIPFAAIPAEDWPFVNDLDNDVATPVVFVVDVPSESDLESVVDSFDSVISSALFAAGLRVYPTGDDDDAMPVVPSTPTQINSLIRRIYELEDEVTRLHSLISLHPHPLP